MIDMSKLLGVAAALVLAAGLSVGDARAITVVDDGDTVAVGPGLETAFVGDIKGRPSGGPSAWEVQFELDYPCERQRARDAVLRRGVHLYRLGDELDQRR